MNLHISRRVIYDPMKNISKMNVKMRMQFSNEKDKNALLLALENGLIALQECELDSGRIDVNIDDSQKQKKKTTKKTTKE